MPLLFLFLRPDYLAERSVRIGDPFKIHALLLFHLLILILSTISSHEPQTSSSHRIHIILSQIANDLHSIHAWLVSFQAMIPRHPTVLRLHEGNDAIEVRGSAFANSVTRSTHLKCVLTVWATIFEKVCMRADDGTYHTRSQAAGLIAGCDAIVAHGFRHLEFVLVGSRCLDAYRAENVSCRERSAVRSVCLTSALAFCWLCCCSRESLGFELLNSWGWSRGSARLVMPLELKEGKLGSSKRKRSVS
jgi:hypothetical protein